MDRSPPGFSVHGISQARILEWAGISSSRGSSGSRDGTHISCIGRQILYRSATGAEFKFAPLAAREADKSERGDAEARNMTLFGEQVAEKMAD